MIKRSFRSGHRKVEKILAKNFVKSLLHRYKRVLELTSGELILNEKDVKKNKEFQLKIHLRNIIDVHCGFDNVFKGRGESMTLEQTAKNKISI